MSSGISNMHHHLVHDPDQTLLNPSTTHNTQASKGGIKNQVGVIKKTFQILITAGLLTAGSQAYRVGFALVEKKLAPPLPKTVAMHSDGAGPATLSKSAQEARTLAAKAFGSDHWSAHKDLKIRFYDAQRGFWIYAQNYESKSVKGNTIRFWPVVFIWRGETSPTQSSESHNLIYGGGDQAILEMSQPLGVIKPGKEPSKIVKAILSGNVSIRDDKATTGREDDLEIGPLADILFDEPTLSIHSESDVRIKDRDLLITGRGMHIELWPREILAPTSIKSDTPSESSNQVSFTGTKSIKLSSQVRIEVANVGKSNVLPGQARDLTTQIPAWLKCDGPMSIDLPRQNLPPKVGPPRPPEPTIATFTKNVLLQRGKDQPDQVTGDALRAELFPSTKTAATTASSSTKSDSKKNSTATTTGPMTELDLKWARVTGDKVFLKSQAQGLTANGKELILKRPGGEKPDEVYLRGSDQNPLVVERIEYTNDKNGSATEQIRSIETLTSHDVTIFDEKPKSDSLGTAAKVANTAVEVATVVARGAGQVEIRDGRNQPVTRSAKWSEQAIMLTEGDGPSARKVITLTGNAMVWDRKSGTLEAGKSLAVWLSPRAKSGAKAQVAKASGIEPGRQREAAASLSSSSYEIETVEAHQNVKLVADNRYVNAKERLDVEFLPGTTTSPNKNPQAIATTDPKLKPTLFVLSDADNNADSESATHQAGAAQTAAAQPSPAKVSIDAKRVWVKLGPGASSGDPKQARNTKPAMSPMGGVELIEARLRGDVIFHQENADPKKQPAHVEAQAVDIVNQGQAAYHLLAFHVDPTDPVAGKPENRVKAKPVKVTSDQFDLEGPILGLDQAASTAWVNGAGTIKQWIGSELLKQDGFKAEGTKSASANSKPQQATITWKTRMDFFGKPLDANGNPLDARAHFTNGVIVRTEGALLSAEKLDTYFDQRIALDQLKPIPTPSSSGGLTEERSTNNQKPQIQFVDAKGNVTILNRRRDSNSRIVQELQRIEGPRLMYDKAKDMVQVDGAGIVRLYQRREAGKTLPGSTDKKPASNRPTENKPFNLTRVAFYNGMHGRLGYDPDAPNDTGTNRAADFFGNVQVINAQVSDEFRDLNIDKPPQDFVFLSSEWLEVESLGDPANPKDPRNLIRAKGTATARSSSMSTQGDQIHFDSREDLFHVIGLNGREVTMAHQSRPGEPASIARGTALVYNNRTGESQLVDPQSIQLVDRNSGRRPTVDKPGSAATKPTPTRTPLRLPPSSNKERRSF